MLFFQELQQYTCIRNSSFFPTKGKHKRHWFFHFASRFYPRYPRRSKVIPYYFIYYSYKPRHSLKGHSFYQTNRYSAFSIFLRRRKKKKRLKKVSHHVWPRARGMFTKHFYHIVMPSIWPVLTSFYIFCLIVAFVTYLWDFNTLPYLLLYCFLCFVFFLLCLTGWFRDIIVESVFCGHHTKQVQKGLTLGFILFLVSEVMFFFGFFWAYFHSALSPSIFIGAQWPPVFIEPFNPWKIPLLNTVILLTSGASVTYSHSWVSSMILYEYIGKANYRTYNDWLIFYTPRAQFQAFRKRLPIRKGALEGLLITIFLGVFFTCVQLFEYCNAPFSINDSVYGSCFYLITGFHGFHVLVGTTFLFVQYHRFIRHHFTSKHYLGYLFSVWYWHFVDIVWLFVFAFLYIWGS